MCYQTELGSDNLRYTCLCTRCPSPILLMDVALFWQQAQPFAWLTILLLKLVLCRPWCWEIPLISRHQTCQHLHAVVIVTTLQPKMNGGVVGDADRGNVEAVRSGFITWNAVENIQIGIPAVVLSMNFKADTEAEIAAFEGTLCLNRCTSEY